MLILPSIMEERGRDEGSNERRVHANELWLWLDRTRECGEEDKKGRTRRTLRVLSTKMCGIVNYQAVLLLLLQSVEKYLEASGDHELFCATRKKMKVSRRITCDQAEKALEYSDDRKNFIIRAVDTVDDSQPIKSLLLKQLTTHQAAFDKACEGKRVKVRTDRMVDKAIVYI